MKLQQGNMRMPKFIAMFKELCKFSIIYKHNLDEVWKCIKFEGGLRENVLVSVRPLVIKGYATLVNKSRLVEEYNKKLVIAKSMRHDFKKKLGP